MPFDFFTKSYSPKFDKYDTPHPQFSVSSDEHRRIADYDLLSPCEYYSELYRQCRAGNHLFTYMWTNGEWPKCDEWMKADQNCRRWAAETKLDDPHQSESMTINKSESRAALDDVLEFERRLIRERSTILARNDVWKLRRTIEERNSNFSEPLPEKVERKLFKLG